MQISRIRQLVALNVDFSGKKDSSVLGSAQWHRGAVLLWPPGDSMPTVCRLEEKRQLSWLSALLAPSGISDPCCVFPDSAANNKGSSFGKELHKIGADA